MRFSKWIGLASAVLLIIACFSTWVIIPSKNIVVSGVNSTGTFFGKPGYFHFFMIAFFVLFTLIQKVWAKRSNLLVTAINLAWAVRNYFIISACRGGECPEKEMAIYLMVLASLGMLISALFPDYEQERKNTRSRSPL